MCNFSSKVNFTLTRGIIIAGNYRLVLQANFLLTPLNESQVNSNATLNDNFAVTNAQFTILVCKV